MFAPAISTGTHAPPQTTEAPVQRRHILDIDWRRWIAVHRWPASLKAVVGLGITQIIGWGTTFSSLTVFGTAIGNELGLPRVVVFAGITLQLLVSALIAPRVGALVDRLGARHIMVVGSCLGAAAMVWQSSTRGLISYMLGWVIVGLTSPLMLNNAAMPGLVQVVGPHARRWISGLTLITGLTGTVFLPINSYMLDAMGWRNAFLVYAALHLVICAPLHWLVLRRGAGINDDPGGSPDRARPPPDGILAPEHKRRAFVLLAVWACTEGTLTWGLYMQVIDVFAGLGMDPRTAAWLWTIVGPCQALARFSDLVLAGRYSILATAFCSALFTSISFLAFLLFGVGLGSAMLFCAVMGVGHGLFAVARNTLPLTLFGAREYGAWMGRLMLPQNVANAAAPMLFAAVISEWSPVGALWIAGFGAALGFASVLMLVRFCRENAKEA